MSLEVKILSGSHLKDVKTIGQQSPYVEVNFGSQQKLTRTATQGGKEPVWDDVFRFEIGSGEWANDMLKLRILADGTLGRAKEVGRVNIRLRALVKADGSVEEKPYFSAYQVLRPSGRPQGVLNVALSVRDAPKPAPEVTAPSTPPGTEYSRARPWGGSGVPPGYPAGAGIAQGTPYHAQAGYNQGQYQQSPYQQQQYPPQGNVPYFAPQMAYAGQPQYGRYGGGGGLFGGGMGGGMGGMGAMGTVMGAMGTAEAMTVGAMAMGEVILEAAILGAVILVAATSSFGRGHEEVFAGVNLNDPHFCNIYQSARASVG
ncbi:hypothetical protein KFL_001330060 [Klebsormidium nitens]|uniref:C2 domain-containing protein n=1 Tax=Klebsormidium nitens TaxID=105231 RepID=A0A0U9HUV3_KLENI|nr:hypothetical protein KFL_001330060 [Klebsormidium nitens]|eukprot:GAQ83024.1 hypothetical protein KFL_001330060 [Klebsormidium nitens]